VNDETMREDFEEWLADEVRRNGGVGFEAALTHWAWKGFRAAMNNRAQASAPEGEADDGMPKTDREMLVYLMQAFDTESWQCPKCGHDEDTATMDSAYLLRDYLSKNTRSNAEAGEVELILSEVWGFMCNERIDWVDSDKGSLVDRIGNYLSMRLAADPTHDKTKA